MNHQEKFRNHIELKYGKHITNVILDSNKLELVKGHANQLYNRGLLLKNKEKVKELIPKYSEQLEENEWAFDFPGWVGELDFKGSHTKEIMVLGMEPHIGKRDFQVTYGLRETQSGMFCELDEYLPNTMLWKNLYGLFGTKSGYRSKEFLNKFYITDMSHFAVQGKASEMLTFKKWKKIRAEVARTFLPQEIELIRPKYIVSQGNDVADFIEYKFLDKLGKRVAKKTAQEFTTLLPKQCKNSPTFKKYEIFKTELIHLRLPHVGSPNSNYFWTPAQPENRVKRLSGIANELIEFEKNRA